MWKILGYFLLAYVVGVFGYFLLPTILDATCQSRWSKSGLEATYIFGSGCMVTVNGRTVPEANVRIGPN